MMAEKHVLNLRLMVQGPPVADPDVQSPEFGVQDKTQALHVGERQPDGALRYICPVTVRPRQGDAPPDFTGPFVHGPKGDRFLYLAWRGADGRWLRRWKIPLGGLTWGLIGQAQADDATLAATVVTGKQVRIEPQDGWAIHAG